MRSRLAFVAIAIALLSGAVPALGQAVRKDAIWARTTATAPVLDGVLNEYAWSRAESTIVRFGVDNGIPGSGWKYEAGVGAQDSTVATLKLLVSGNQMYLGARVRDKSIGGSLEFNRFDGILMAIKDHAVADAPKPPAEYMYTWWYPETMDPQPPGQLPSFWGRWANWPPGSARTPEQIANWDAVTVVNGLSNSDAANDVSYTVEMRFNLAPMGYDVTRPQGDIVEWNISIYDCDWFWPIDNLRMTSNRVWWQGPWGNNAWYDEMRVFAKPSVTVDTAVPPAIAPELRVANGAGMPAPVVDGLLNDAIWSKIQGFDIRYGEAALRLTYPGVGPHRAGQYQPPVNGGQAYVADPGDATVKMFFRGNTFYMGFDVRDWVVQYHPSVDRWDGFMVLMNDVVQRYTDNNLLSRRLSFQVGSNGQALPQDYLLQLVNEGGAQVALALKAGTTVDTLGLQQDTGYTAEVSVNLTKLGYPSGLGDGTLFLGLDLMDGDSFPNPADSYGTRTWWFRQYEYECCPIWAYLDPAFLVGVDEPSGPLPQKLVIIGAEPNPFQSGTQVQYSLGMAGRVSFDVFDIQGRLIEKRALGMQAPGIQSVWLDGSRRAAGVYHYRIRVEDPATGEVVSSAVGRVVKLK
jgi:hypothetical protein